MMRTLSRIVLTALCAWHASLLPAQNITNYGSMPEPYLLLLREPAVLDDLQLNARQRQELEDVNQALDGPLLASRNTPPEKQRRRLPSGWQKHGSSSAKSWTGNRSNGSSRSRSACGDIARCWMRRLPDNSA